MNELTLVETEPQNDAVVSAISDQFASRGLVRSVLQEARMQVSAEEKTRELAPDAYRLSLLSEETVNTVWRGGKDTMSGEDLIRYAQDSMETSREGKNYADIPSVYESADATDLDPVSVTKEKTLDIRKISEDLKTLPAVAVETVKERAPLWFDPQRADVSAERRKFPLSAFAAVVAIAVSMMLIVASALMVNGAKSRNIQLNSEITALTKEVNDMRSDLEAGSDLLEIRRIAVEEFGMVEENYLKMGFIELESTEEIELFEHQQSREIGLSALLSAIGLKK